MSPQPGSSPKDERARWMRELERLSGFKTQILLYGNVKDTVLYPLGWGDNPSVAGDKLGSLREALFEFLNSRGVYQIVGAYNLIDGLVFSDTAPMSAAPSEPSPTAEDKDRPSMSRLYEQLIVENEKVMQNLLKGFGRAPRPYNPEEPFDVALQQMRLCLLNRRVPCAFVLEHASQLIASTNQLQMAERLSFLRLVKTAGESGIIPIKREGVSREAHNLLIIVADRLTDVPTWLYLNNPFAGGIEVEVPRASERRHFFDLYLPASIKNKETQGERGFDDLVDLTDGMSVRDLYGIRKVARETKTEDGIPLKFKELVDRYRYGDRESEWDSLSPTRLVHAEAELGKRVIGQEAAVSACADVLRRARLHLSGAQHSSRSKPRGILFFAGPTGVGKTELAKAMAELVFGTEEACLRFDMSEYGQANSDQRLLGAPPGYVGYEEGGQLTNRVKANPFSVLLFDEIEKAHPSVLDKFLQILEDGRMTDGRGDTVYFGESLIVFTSNAGIYQLDPHTTRPMIDPVTGSPILNVNPEIDIEYPVVREKMLEGVQGYFKHVLGRPELLNRIGQNIVVFDFVREPVMRLIVERKVLPSIASQIRERWKINIHFEPKVVDQLMELGGGDVSSGGRGIGNVAEAAVLNPLSRVIFEMMTASGNNMAALEGQTLSVRELVPPLEGAGRYNVLYDVS